MDFIDEDSPPATPTKSEFDTFQVLSNTHFVDFNKEKPNSKLLHSPTASPRVVKELPEKVLLNPEDEEDDYAPPTAPSLVPSTTISNFDKNREELKEYYKEAWGGEEEDKDAPEEYMETPPPRYHTPPPPPAPAPQSVAISPSKFKYHSPIRPEPSSYPTKSKFREDDIDSVDSELLMEIESEKEALLQELNSLESQGLYNPVRKLSMKDKLEEIQFHYDKAQSEMSTSEGVEMVKGGIKMGSVVLEFVLKKLGITLVEGFSTNLNKDPSKFNRPLTKLYKKYWRRGSSSPEMELAMIVLGSLAWTMVQNKLHGVGNVKPDPPEIKAPVLAPPKVNLMQFQKEKDLQNKINELEKKIESMQPETPKSVYEPPPKVFVASPKKVNLNMKTNSMNSQTSTLRKGKSQIKL